MAIIDATRIFFVFPIFSALVGVGVSGEKPCNLFKSEEIFKNSVALDSAIFELSFGYFVAWRRALSFEDKKIIRK